MRIVQLILFLLQAWITKAMARTRADDAAVTADEKAKHRAHDVDGQGDQSQPDVSHRLRDGTF